MPALDSAEHRAWIAAIERMLSPAPADVLDIATGTGYLALIAAGLGHRVTGIDLAVPMLDEARKAARDQSLGVEFREGDAVEPPFAPGSFDAITCRHFLWTLREPETAFGNWHALLRDGGRVIAIDGFWFATADQPAEDDPADLFGSHYTQTTRAALPGMQVRTPDWYVAMFEAAGFGRVITDSLAAVHAVAEDPPGEEPWYVVIAER